MATQTFTPEIAELRSTVAVYHTQQLKSRLYQPTRASGIPVGLLRLVCYVIVAMALTITTYGADPTFPRTVGVKDRHGTSVLTIGNIQLFHRSAPFFHGIVKNVSGADLTLDTLTGTVRKKDGSTVQFAFNVCAVRWCDLPKDSVREVSYPFSKPWPFAAADVVSVEFSLPTSWVSPEDNRIAEEQARRNTAEAERDAKAAEAALAQASIKPTYELKDRHGIPVMTLSKIEMFRYMSVTGEYIADFTATVENISGEDLKSVYLVVKVHREDGWEPIVFTVKASDDFKKDATLQVTHPFAGRPYTPRHGNGVESVEFALPESWQSPEDDRLAAQAEEKFAAAVAKAAAAEAKRESEEAAAQAKKAAAEAARRKRLAAEQQREQAQADAQHAKEKAEEDANVAEEQRQVRAACALIYKDTADKKIGDLTVKEEQQVRTCQALDLYPPR
jgi:hypothetical protein